MASNPGAADNADGRQDEIGETAEKGAKRAERPRGPLPACFDARAIARPSFGLADRHGGYHRPQGHPRERAGDGTP